jgi:hypothetical protein
MLETLLGLIPGAAVGAAGYPLIMKGIPALFGWIVKWFAHPTLTPAPADMKALQADIAQIKTQLDAVFASVAVKKPA